MTEKILLTEWHAQTVRTGEVFDALCSLADSWAVSTLLNELMELSVKEHEAWKQLEAVGMHDKVEAFQKVMALEGECSCNEQQRPDSN